MHHLSFVCAAAKVVFAIHAHELQTLHTHMYNNQTDLVNSILQDAICTVIFVLSGDIQEAFTVLIRNICSVVPEDAWVYNLAILSSVTVMGPFNPRWRK